MMNNELHLGDVLDSITPSDRVLVVNAAKQVVYRGYAANAAYSNLSRQRKVKKFGIGMETYRATDKLWDWEKTDKLPEQVPVEQFSEYKVEQLQHILYIRIELKNEFERREHEARMGTSAAGRNASCYSFTTPEMVAENGSR